MAEVCVNKCLMVTRWSLKAGKYLVTASSTLSRPLAINFKITVVVPMTLVKDAKS